MKLRNLFALGVVLFFAAFAFAQGSSGATPPGQSSGNGPGVYGRRSGGGMGMMGRGTTGTVTEVAADHYTIKTDAGEVYSVRFDSNTRIVKQSAGGGGGRSQNGAGDWQGGQGGGGMGRGNPPEQIKASDIKAGDVVSALGNTDATEKTIAATFVTELDPLRVQQMRAMEANFGKTWLAGKVTTIDGTKITLTGAMDNASHTVAADENTTFRKRRDPVTLADIQVGDTVRVDGTLKDGVFTATAVIVGGVVAGGDEPHGLRNAPSQ